MHFIFELSHISICAYARLYYKRIRFMCCGLFFVSLTLRGVLVAHAYDVPCDADILQKNYLSLYSMTL